MKISAILFFFCLISCSNSAEIDGVKIKNVMTPRHHYIPYLNSYIIIPDSFDLAKDYVHEWGVTSGGATQKRTKAYLSWTSKSDENHDYYEGLKHHIQIMIQGDRHNTDYHIAEEKVLINGKKAMLLSDDYGDQASPDRKITNRLIFEKGDSVYEFVGNILYGRDKRIEDSLRFALLSVIPWE